MPINSWLGNTLGTMDVGMTARPTLGTLGAGPDPLNRYLGVYGPRSVTGPARGSPAGLPQQATEVSPFMLTRERIRRELEDNPQLQRVLDQNTTAEVGTDPAKRRWYQALTIDRAVQSGRPLGELVNNPDTIRRAQPERPPPPARASTHPSGKSSTRPILPPATPATTQKPAAGSVSRAARKQRVFPASQVVPAQRPAASKAPPASNTRASWVTRAPPKRRSAPPARKAAGKRAWVSPQEVSATSTPSAWQPNRRPAPEPTPLVRKEPDSNFLADFLANFKFKPAQQAAMAAPFSFGRPVRSLAPLGSSKGVQQFVRARQASDYA